MTEVRVVKAKSRKFLVLRWVDAKGVTRQQSAKTTKMREALKVATKKAKELERESKDAGLSWREIRQRFEEEHASRTGTRTQTSYATALNKFAEFVDPQTAADISDERLHDFVTACIQDEMSPVTIGSYLNHLKVVWRRVLRWGLIDQIPEAKAPKATHASKGRPLTVEEFERYLAAINRLIKDRDKARMWRFDATAIWLSGLRIWEACEIAFDDPQTLQVRGLHRSQPMLWIPENLDKSRKESITPLTPDFVEFLRENAIEATGHVLNLVGERKPRLGYYTVSNRFAEFGREAGIVSKIDHRGKPVYASAHDLRRSFGDRWACEVEAAVLQKMMRHSSIQTTLTYYANVNAHKMGQKINDAWVQKPGGTDFDSNETTSLKVDQIAKDRDKAK